MDYSKNLSTTEKLCLKKSEILIQRTLTQIFCSFFSDGYVFQTESNDLTVHSISEI